MYKSALFCLTAILVVCAANAQTMPSAADGHDSMSAAQARPQDEMQMRPSSFLDFITQHTTSGTDAQPNSTPTEMVMMTKGSWTLMFHGEAFLNELQQTGPRGADKFFSTNWFMPMAQRKFGTSGTLTLRTMLSLEPATVSSERYPELFQQGETAFGRTHRRWPAPARFLHGNRRHL